MGTPGRPSQTSIPVLGAVEGRTDGCEDEAKAEAAIGAVVMDSGGGVGARGGGSGRADAAGAAGGTTTGGTDGAGGATAAAEGGGAISGRACSVARGASGT